MSSPIGHAIAGAIFYRAYRFFTTDERFNWQKDWQPLLFFIVLAGLPDLDVFDFADPQLHRTFSHSILFALVAGGLGAVIFQRWQRPRTRAFWWLIPATLLSHLLMDICCIDHIPPYGAQIFWPFSKAYVYTPLPFMTSVGTFKALGHTFKKAFVESAFLESLVMGSLYFAVSTCFTFLQNRRRLINKQRLNES